MRDVYRTPATLITDTEMARQDRQPSRFSATPEDIDAFLHQEFAEDTLLKFYQWVGQHAVFEAVVDGQGVQLDEPEGHTIKPQWREAWLEGKSAVLNRIDYTEDGGPYPTKLPVGHPNSTE
jgi:hypothetical protein